MYNEMDWVALAIFVGAILSSLLVGYVINKQGKKDDGIIRFVKSRKETR